MEAYETRAFAEALEVIASTLVEDAGLDPNSIMCKPQSHFIGIALRLQCRVA